MTYFSWSSDSALYLQPYKIGRHHTLGTCWSDNVNDLILFVGHCDLYFMVSDFALYL